jgi:hypothetical protein
VAHLIVLRLHHAAIVGTNAIPLLGILGPIHSHMLMLGLLMVGLLMLGLGVELLLERLVVRLPLELLMLGRLVVEWLVLGCVRAMLTSKWWSTLHDRANVLLVRRMQSLRRGRYTLLRVASRAGWAAV